MKYKNINLATTRFLETQRKRNLDTEYLQRFNEKGNYFFFLQKLYYFKYSLVGILTRRKLHYTAMATAIMTGSVARFVP